MEFAINVTVLPAQIVEEEVEILIAGVKDVVTFITIVLDVAGDPVTQVKLDVIITFTTSPFANDEVVYVGEFDPALLPLTCHW